MPAADAPGTAPAERMTAIRHALVFLAICSPIWLLPKIFSVAHPIVMAALVVALTSLALRREGRSLSVLGLDPSWRRLRELAMGVAGGALLILLMAIGVRLLLPFPWARNPNFSGATAAFALLWLLCGNAVEELVFRGYSFERLVAGVGLWPAQVVTAMLFVVFHRLEGWTWLQAITGTVIASFLFGLVFVRWHSVPAAAGVHAASNWMRELVLSDPPTATTLYAPLSPRHWTQNEQGAALLLMDGIFLLAIVVLARDRWSGSLTV